jgi:hypothetical protein
MFTININGIKCNDIVTIVDGGTRAFAEITDLIGAGVFARSLPKTLNVNGRAFNFFELGGEESDGEDVEDTGTFNYTDGRKILTIIND